MNSNSFMQNYLLTRSELALFPPFVVFFDWGKNPWINRIIRFILGGTAPSFWQIQYFGVVG
jgi:hypothetical protein